MGVNGTNSELLEKIWKQGERAHTLFGIHQPNTLAMVSESECNIHVWCDPFCEAVVSNNQLIATHVGRLSNLINPYMVVTPYFRKLPWHLVTNLFLAHSMSSMSKKRNVNNNSGSIPLATQSANKQRLTSTPAFRVAWAPSGPVINCTSQLTTIRTNCHGQWGYLTGNWSLLPDPNPNLNPLSSPFVNKELPGKTIPDPPLPLDLGQLNDDSQTSIPPKPAKPKRKWQNTTLVCVLALIYLN